MGVMKTVEEIEKMLTTEESTSKRRGLPPNYVSIRASDTHAFPHDHPTIRTVARVIHALLREAVNEAVGTAVRSATEPNP